MNFYAECVALGRASAAAGLRRNAAGPPAYLESFDSYQGPRKRTNYFSRKVLSLRLSALKRGMVVDSGLTAGVLRRITGKTCIVSLVPFSDEPQSPSRPSVDRLDNDGTYAIGNLCVLARRVNGAKAERTFLQVAEIARQGVDHDGLTFFEWARLAPLMYGAYDARSGGHDPFIVPMATVPGPQMFTAQSQLVQLLMLEGLLIGGPASLLQEWVTPTKRAGLAESRVEDLVAELTRAVEAEDYPPTAWLSAAVFGRFVDWYRAARGPIADSLAPLRARHQANVETAVLVSRWRTGQRWSMCAATAG